jgi:excinuclease UvrABC nuclease subunit
MPLESESELPDIPAVYFVLDEENRILYIGSTKSLNRHWVHHPKLKHLEHLFIRLRRG